MALTQKQDEYLFDADSHVLEPPDMWDNYLEPKFRRRGIRITPDAPDFFVGRIETTLSNEPGSLSVLSTLIAKNQGNISNLKISGRTPDFFDMLVDIEVRDVKHLNNIIAALRGSPHVSKVERTHG